jgi:tetratricopeptide (TPR) repeat protein
MPPPRLRVFISSPGDVAEERVLANNLIRRLSDEFADRIWIEPVFWEHEPLLATDTFQKQIPPPHDCEVAICILWGRLGTRLPSNIKRPDGTTYASGTEFEFEDAADSFHRTGHPQLLVYRKRTELLVNLKDTAEVLERIHQKEALDQFVNKWFLNEADGTIKAAYHSFHTPGEFLVRLEEHLRKLIEQRFPPREHSLARPKLAWTQGSPFRGLNVFEFEHAPIYFGRTQAIGDVLNALRVNAAAGRGFVLVAGVSGGGKSSLVQAGVLPLLVEPGVIEGVALWRRATLKPGDADGDLFKSLATALLAPGALPELATDGTTLEELARLLQQTPEAAFALIKGGLSQAANTLLREQSLKQMPAARLVIFVDQLEELFTAPGIQAPHRIAFVKALDVLARSGKVWVLATMRGDFYHRAFEIPQLVALQEGSGLFALPLPTPAQIGQMINQPAHAAGLSFEEDPQTKIRLDELLRDAASASPESLPLLEFALDELYQRKTPQGLLTYAAYHDLGGVEGALTKRAEAVFTSLPPQVQVTLPWVIRGLVRVNEGGGFTRFTGELGKYAWTDQANQLIEAFVHARLFSADRRPDGQAVVRVTHEALLTHWQRLRDWLENNRQNLQILTRVDTAAERWNHEQRRTDLLLPAGEPLAEALKVREAFANELAPTVASFIEASRRQAVQHTWIKRTVAAGVLALLVLALAVTLYARNQQQNVLTERRQHLAAELGDIRARIKSPTTAPSQGTSQTTAPTRLFTASDLADAAATAQRAIAIVDRPPALTEQTAIHQLNDKTTLLADFARSSDTAWFAAGDERNADARSASERSLAALPMFEDPAWWNALAAQSGFPGSQAVGDLRNQVLTEAHRQYLLLSLLLMNRGLVTIEGVQAKLAALQFGQAADDRAKSLAYFQKAADTLRRAAAMEHRHPDLRSSALIIMERLCDLGFGLCLTTPQFSPPPSPPIPLDQLTATDAYFVGLANFFFAAMPDDHFSQMLKNAMGLTATGHSADLAEQYLRVATARAPGDYWPAFMLGWVLAAEKKYDQAEVAFNTCIAIQPQNPRGYEQRALALINQAAAIQQPDQQRALQQRAAADLNHSQSLAGKTDPSDFWTRADYNRILGHPADAIESYTQALEHDPDILQTISRRNALNIASTYALSIVKSNPTNASAYALLAMIHQKTGDHQKALEEFQHALKLDPNNQTAKRGLSQALNPPPTK